MKIIFIIPSLSSGGAERVISLLSNEFVTQNIDISLVLFRNEIDYELNNKVKICLPDFQYRDFKFVFLRLMKYVRKTVIQQNPNVVVSFLEYYNPFNIIALQGTKYPIVISDRNSPTMKQDIVHQVLRYFFYPKASAFIAQTNQAKNFILHKKLNQNVYLIPNPIISISETHNGIDSKTITYVGRLTQIKNIDFLIRCLANLNRESWKLQIVGEGHSKSQLIEFASSLGISSRVDFLGKRNDVLHILSESAIFAFPSLREGFPNALMEAMGVGLPCIAFDCMTGPSELIQDGENGFLISTDNPELFEEKLGLLMDNKEIRMKFSKKAQKIKQQYDIKKHYCPTKILIQKRRQFKSVA